MSTVNFIGVHKKKYFAQDIKHATDVEMYSLLESARTKSQLYFIVVHSDNKHKDIVDKFVSKSSKH